VSLPFNTIQNKITTQLNITEKVHILKNKVYSTHQDLLRYGLASLNSLFRMLPIAVWTQPIDVKLSRCIHLQFT